MAKFSEELASKDRWLVFNKIDLLPEDQVASRCEEIVKRTNWQGPIFKISAIKKIGTKELCYKLMEYFLEKKKAIS